MLTPTSHGVTDVGRRRSRNEDAFYADDGRGLYVVCDGMGGHAAGDVASRTAVDAVCGAFERRAPALGTDAAPQLDRTGREALVAGAVEAACAAVYERASGEPELAGMGTTIVVALVTGDEVIVGHVGDSRAYLWRGGQAHQITNDHTLAAALVSAGAMRPDEAARSKQAHLLTRALGLQPSVEIETQRVQLLPGDRLLLCTDGVSDHATGEGHLPADVGEGSVSEAAAALVAQANTLGGHDNATALVIGVSARDRERTAPMVRHRTAELAAMGDSFLFRGMTLREYAAIRRHLEVRNVADGEPLVRAGEPFGALVIVVEGELVASSPEHPAAQVFGVGSHLGAALLAAGRPARHTLVARSECRVLYLDRVGLTKLAESAPRVASQVLARLFGLLSSALADVVERYPKAVREPLFA